MGREHRRQGAGAAASTARAGAAYLAVAILRYHDVLFSGHGYRQVGVFGDPMMFDWQLAWQAHALSHGLSPFWTGAVNAPAGANLLNSTSVPLLGWVSSPLTWLAGPVATYNVLIVLAAALSALAAFAALRPFCRRPASAWLGGLIYGFGGFVATQSQAHLNLAFAPFPPLAILVLHRLLRRPGSLVTGFGLGVVVAAEFFVSEELAATTVLLIGVVVCLVGPQRVLRESGTALLIGALTTLTVLGGPIAYQFFGPQSHVARLLQPRNVYVADLAGFVVPSAHQLFSTAGARNLAAKLTGLDGEFSTYLGAPVLLFAAVTAWRMRRDAVVRVAAGTFIVFAILALGPSLHIGGNDVHIWMPWRLVDHVPVVQNVLPDRFAVYIDLAAAFLVALGVDRLTLDVPARRRWLVLALGLAVALPMAPALPGLETSVEVPPFFTGPGVTSIPRNANVIVTPLTEHGEVAMVWQAVSGFRYRMPEGAVFVPGGYGAPADVLFRALRAIEATGVQSCAAGCRTAMLQDLRALNVACVVTVLYGPHAAAVKAFFTNLLGRAPFPVDGVFLWCTPFG